MKLSGQFHAPLALPPEKKPWHKFPGTVTNPFFPRFHTKVKKMRYLKIDILFPVAKTVT